MPPNTFLKCLLCSTYLSMNFSHIFQCGNQKWFYQSFTRSLQSVLTSNNGMTVVAKSVAISEAQIFLLKLKPETRSLWLKFWKSIYRLTPDSNHHHSIVISLVSLMNSWWWFLIMYSRCAYGEIANRYNLYGSKSLLIMQVLILNYRSHLLIVTSFVSHFYWHARQRRYFDIGIMQ